MAAIGFYSKKYQKRITFLLLAGVLSFSTAAWLLVVHGAIAATEYTPYAVAVAGQSGLSIGTAQNAVGPPDGQSSNLVGVASSITLDMGEGQEGTGSLQLDLAQVVAQGSVTVGFLDSNQSQISSVTQTVVATQAPATSVFSYDWHTAVKAYRYVKVSTTLSVGLGMDAVEKQGYIGATATQDLDGDSIPDRQDANPLVADKQNGGGGTNGTNGSNGSNGGSGGSGSSGGSSSSSSGSDGLDSSSLTGASRPVTSASNEAGIPFNARLVSFIQHAWSWILFFSLMVNALLAFFVAWVFAGARPLTKHSTKWDRWHHRVYQAFLPTNGK